MAFGVSYQSAAPILGALLGGQYQGREREEDQAFQQASFLAQLLERQRQFNEGLAFDKRRQQLSERQADFSNRMSMEELAQRERLSRMNTAAQFASQQQAQRGRLEAMQLGHAQDMQARGFQAQANRQNMVDQNVFAANNAAMAAEANALLRHNFPTQEAFQDAWGQHNRKRQMMGLGAMDPPPWQQPPPDPRQAAWQRAEQAGWGKFAIPDEQGMPSIPRGFQEWMDPQFQQREAAKAAMDAQVEAQKEAAKAAAEEAAAQREHARAMEIEQMRIDAAAEKPSKDAYSEEGRIQYITDRIKEAQEKDIAGGLEITPELRDQYSREYDIIHGKKPPGNVSLPESMKTGIAMPGSQEHGELLEKWSVSPEQRIRLSRLPIVTESEWPHMPPGEYGVINPDTGEVIHYIKTTPAKPKGTAGLRLLTSGAMAS